MKPLHAWKHEPRALLGASSGNKSKNDAIQRGLAYHRKVYTKLQEVAPPEVSLLIEPWFREQSRAGTLRSPDTVLLNTVDKTALVIEVKLNWKDGRDIKLVNEYLPIVKSAFALEFVWPLLITANLRGYQHPPLLGLGKLEEAYAWHPGDPTPLMLVL